MTAPLGLPTWEIDDLRIAQAQSLDSLGREWLVDADKGESGWLGAPAPRNNRTARINGIGSYRSRSFAAERVITLAGSVWCPTVSLREQTELQLAGLCGDGGRLYTYRRTTDDYDLTCAVEKDAETMVKVVTRERLDWSFQFAAPDPRKHSFAWQNPISTLPTGGAGGIDPALGVLPTSGYILTGTASAPSIATVANYGTAPCSPLFTITGAIVQPQIVHLESGATLTYAGQLVAGDVLTINCDEFTTLDLLPHSCLLNGTQNVRPYLAHPVDWPVIPPQGVAHFQLQATGTSTAQLTTRVRSAYY